MPDPRGSFPLKGRGPACYDGLCWLVLIRYPSSTCSQSPRSATRIRTPGPGESAGRHGERTVLSMIVREVLGNGLRLLTESMPHVRSISVGVWLTRGSRHEPEDRSGIAHFVEHMLFKGTATRSAEDIAQEIDSIGGQLDAFTAKEYASYYIKVLDEHLPRALEVLSDIVLHPAFDADDIEREKKVILEEIKMVEDTPGRPRSRAVHPELLGRPPARPADPRHAGDGGSAHAGVAARLFPPGLHREQLRDLGRREPRTRARARAGARRRSPTSCRPATWPPTGCRGSRRRSRFATRTSSRATSAWGRPATRRATQDRYVSYVLNTLLGGSMSSRLFQNVREKRGLAYAVFSGLSAYRDAGRADHLRGLRQRGGRRGDRPDGRGTARHQADARHPTRSCAGPRTTSRAA